MEYDRNAAHLSWSRGYRGAVAGARGTSSTSVLPTSGISAAGTLYSADDADPGDTTGKIGDGPDASPKRTPARMIRHTIVIIPHDGVLNHKGSFRLRVLLAADAVFDLLTAAAGRARAATRTRFGGADAAGGARLGQSQSFLQADDFETVERQTVDVQIFK